MTCAAGPPDAGLTGRVHSALVEAPERRGPVWIAGLAAALIAAMAVGALFIAGPLRQQNQQPLPAVGAVKDLLAFYNEAVDITVDGETLERPVTPFTETLSGRPST